MGFAGAPFTRQKSMSEAMKRVPSCSESFLIHVGESKKISDRFHQISLHTLSGFRSSPQQFQERATFEASWRSAESSMTLEIRMRTPQRMEKAALPTDNSDGQLRAQCPRRFTRGWAEIGNNASKLDRKAVPEVV